LKGDGNSYTIEYIHFNPRIGKWLSHDPLTNQFPLQSSYCAMDNNPIILRDIKGSSTEDWVRRGNGKISWDSSVKTDKQAIDKYGNGASMVNIGYEFKNANGVSFVLGENANFTQKGKSKVADDFSDSQESISLPTKPLGNLHIGNEEIIIEL